MKRNYGVRLAGVFLISLIIGIFIGTFIINQPSIEPPNSDYAQFWLGGRMILDGLNPYDAAAWQAETAKLGGHYVINLVYIYPLPLTILFAPLALLSLENSFITWIALTITTLATIGFLLFEDGKHQNKWAFFPLYLIGVFFLRGSLATMVGGHLGGVLAIFFALSIVLARREQWIWTGFFLAFTVLKPTITGVALLLLAIWLLVNRNWKAIIGGASGGLTLYLIGAFKNPHWIQEFLAQGREHGTIYYHFTPSLWGLSARFCGMQSPCGEILATILSLLVFGIGIWLILKHAYKQDMGFVITISILISLIVTPYLWAHDHVLLVVPFAYLLTTLIKKEISFLYTGLVILAFIVFAFGMLFVAMPTQQDQWSVLVPLVMLGIILLSLRNPKSEG